MTFSFSKSQIHSSVTSMTKVTSLCDIVFKKKHTMADIRIIQSITKHYLFNGAHERKCGKGVYVELRWSWSD